RQDLAREALPLAVHHALVVHPWRTDLHRPRPQRHRPLLRSAVAHNLGVAPLVAVLLQLADVLLHLDLQRRLEHPLRTATGDLVQQRHFLFDRLVLYLPHRRTFPRPARVGARVSLTRKGTPPSSAHAVGRSTTTGDISESRRGTSPDLELQRGDLWWREGQNADAVVVTGDDEL